MQRFRGGLVFKANRLGVLLNSRLERNKEEKGVAGRDIGVPLWRGVWGVRFGAQLWGSALRVFGAQW